MLSHPCNGELAEQRQVFLRCSSKPSILQIFNVQTGRYEQAIKGVIFHIEDAPKNAWLCLEPQQLMELSLECEISVEDGCKLSLAVYTDDIPQWTYTYNSGFGIF
jgi:CRISPR-associated endonuclease/helicase Cas3